ncbi:hypothetical protein [uncultured Cutibacterium sp.]|uniref:hypothetical protein n=1 Tax=uncultured Cutibacterium sp. TaxID=1912223 RepID=UPI0025948D2E|nr:hypothetical protein [uncultured Cutibacterium sp.]
MSAVDIVGLGGGWANTVNVSTWQPSLQLAMACLVAGAWVGDLAPQRWSVPLNRLA